MLSRRSLLVAAPALILPSRLRAQVPMTGAGLGKPASGGGYTGPGDVATFSNWWGLRAFSAAKAAATAKCVQIGTISSTNTQDINSTTSGGIDTTAMDTWVGLHGTPYVIILYDQVGSANISIGGTPGQLVYTSGLPKTAYILGPGAYGTASGLGSQPFLVSGVFYTTSGAGDGSAFWGTGDGNLRGETRTTNLLGIYAGSAFATQSLSLSTWLSLQGLYNDSANKSVANVNGSDGSQQNVGTNGTGSQFIFGSEGGIALAGRERECGFIGSALNPTATNSAIVTEQRAYWGY